ncbi:MAG: GTPase ObgE, partial [Planctomycetota bacterium]
MFIDETKIFVRGGKGGNGCLSFRREKYIPRGGPDGGNGGDGGSIIFITDKKLSTLADISKRTQYFAQNGKGGEGSNKSGKKGRDVVIKLPAGTVIWEIIKNPGNNDNQETSGQTAEERKVICELLTHNQKFITAAGGKGGRGNKAFATPTHQVPRERELGQPGEEKYLYLELKLIADIGLVGLPNSGKSTLLSRISDATPKIASYPFTTLVPALGITELDKERRLVVADLPGLIEGAHEGTGLGDEFLRHIERTKVILHLIDCAPLSGPKPREAYEIVRKELQLYSKSLASKPEVIVLNKIDLVTKSVLKKIVKEFGLPVYTISGVTGEGLKNL